MDLITVQERPLRQAPRVGDPWLRAQLPSAVLGRPGDDPVDRQVWWQVAQCLEATGHAVACGQDGTDPASTAILATFALDDTACALAALQRDLAGRTTQPVPASSADRQDGRLSPVERTWFRLAGLLATPTASDPELLTRLLEEHCRALAGWRDVLRSAVQPRTVSV